MKGDNDPRLARLDGLKQTFGARQVSCAQRRDFVRALFDGVAPRYDLMNDLMSFGLHRYWKAMMARRVADALPPQGGVLVDLAGGTGDVALAVRHRSATARMVVVDASSGMLEVARSRAAGTLELVHASAEDLPLEDASVDVVSLAFGLRNMTDPAAALREVNRVLKPGGRIVLLEFSKPQAWFAPFYGLFSRFVIPALGAAIATNRGAYRYLVESIRLFPDADSISRELAEAGFADIAVRRFMFGVAALHDARKA